MKFKKAFAVILAVAMVITLMPTMAFATTVNNVPKVLTVAADEGIPSTKITLTLSDNWAANDAQKIALSLGNAEWSAEKPENFRVNTADKSKISEGAGSGRDVLTVTALDKEGAAATGKIELEYTKSGENTLEFSIKHTVGLPAGSVVVITFASNAIQSGVEVGDVTVTFSDSVDSQINSGTYTIARVSGSVTTATVEDKIYTYPRGNRVGAPITIRETAINSLPVGSRQVIRLTLPKGVTWNTPNPITIGGDMAYNGVQTTPTMAGGDSLLIENISDMNNRLGYKIISSGDENRILEFAFIVTGTSDDRNVMTITPNIKIGRNAAVGDIGISLVSLQAKVNDAGTLKDTKMVTDGDDLVIAKCGEENVVVSTVEEVPTIISGFEQDSKNKDFIITVTLEEMIEKSLVGDRYVDFDLPEEVQIRGPIYAKVDKYSKSKMDNNHIEVNGSKTNDGDKNKDTSGFSFIVPGTESGSAFAGMTWATNVAHKVTFEVPVTVEAGFTGDITMSVSGAKAGVSDTELVVAKADTPISIETKTTEVRNGVQTQAVSDIKIVEKYPGYLWDRGLKDGSDEMGDIILDIDTLGLFKSMVFESCGEIEVTDGNLELGKRGTNNSGDGQQITIEVVNPSTKASTIEIKNVKVALNRTLPEGGYKLDVFGDAVRDNAGYNDNKFANAAAVFEKYVDIITPAESATGGSITATFVIGESKYTKNGEEVTMDAACFLDHDRTYVPVRFMANALGIEDSNIGWYEGSQTVRLTAKDRVVTMQVGSTVIETSVGTITSDVPVLNKGGRTYLPARFVANALGANVDWNNDTRTVTITK